MSLIKLSTEINPTFQWKTETKDSSEQMFQIVLETLGWEKLGFKFCECHLFPSTRLDFSEGDNDVSVSTCYSPSYSP